MQITPTAQVSWPVATKKPERLTVHEDTRVDDYYWLNQRENPEIVDYLKADNEYYEKSTQHLDEVRENLYQEIVNRIPGNDSSVPHLSNGCWYQTVYTSGLEYEVYTRRCATLKSVIEGCTLNETILDVNELAKEKDYCAVGCVSVSPSNKLLAYSVDFVGRRIYTIYFKDLTTGVTLPYTLENCCGSFVWANDSRTLFYATRNTETLRSDRVFRYRLPEKQEKQEQSVEIYYELDETYSVQLSKTKSRKYILIHSIHTESTEVRYLDANNSFDDDDSLMNNDPVVFHSREKKLRYYLDHLGDHWYIRTDKDHPNRSIMKTKLDQTGKECWETVIPGRDQVFIEDIELFQDYLVLLEQSNATPHLRVISLSPSLDGESKPDYYIPFTEDARCLEFGDNKELNISKLRFTYESLKTPESTYDFDMATRTMTHLKTKEVVGGHNPDDYITQRVFFSARDSATLVPISLVYHKTTPINGTAPLLLYGYGSYGYSMSPHFDITRLSLLQRGFIYAIAHIRGGRELGEKWYENGKMLNKLNTFTDFIDAGQWLVNNGYTNSDRLFAYGGSAGGLLMGAVLNMAPNLWRGVVAAVPFVDVVTTMLDDSIPLTTFEYKEWGNPNESKYYHYMKSYSPYDNVEKQEYPAIFILTGFHDSQVQYWEPAKWVAKLRALKTDDNPLYFYTDMEAGHSGASGRFTRHKETAKIYTFFLDLAKKI